MTDTSNNQNGPPMDDDKKEPTPEERLKQCERERDEYLNGWKRAKADLINYQREEGQRIETLVKFGSEGILKDLIVVMDSFDLALAMEGERGKGLVMIRSQLESALRKNGLEPIKALEEKFNPAFHEVIEEVESEREPGTVVEEVSRGWKLHEKVIRPARVKVAKVKGQLTTNN